MKLPVHPPESSPRRHPHQVRALAIAVQANLVQLRVAECRRRGLSSAEHDIRVPSPGTVKHFREALIERAVIDRYSDEEVHLRLHEVWGQYCALCWLFSLPADQAADRGLADLDDHAEMHCETAVEIKITEVHALLWRLRFELRQRHEPGYRQSPAWADDEPMARTIPAEAHHKPVSEAADTDVLLAACEHVGMLAILRWTMDGRTVWGDASLLDVAETPFPEPPPAS